MELYNINHKCKVIVDTENIKQPPDCIEVNPGDTIYYYGYIDGMYAPVLKDFKRTYIAAWTDVTIIEE